MSNGLTELRTTFGKVLIGILWATVVLVTAVALLHGGTPLMTGALGIVLAGTATLFWRHDPISPLTRYVSSGAVSGLVALLVLEFARQPLQIDMHMAFFTGLAVVAVWCCWMSVVVAGAVVAVHHLMLNFLYPYAVF